MKKLLFVLLVIALPLFYGCEKENLSEGYPEMEGFYFESLGLPVVTIDSVKLFTQRLMTTLQSTPNQRNTPYIPRFRPI